jgi:hypothetical protein
MNPQAEERVQIGYGTYTGFIVPRDDTGSNQSAVL